MSIGERIHRTHDRIHRRLKGEAVQLLDAEGEIISAEILDALVSLRPAVVAHGSGPAEHEGVLRLVEANYADAKNSHLVRVRGNVWHILTVGDIYGGRFRVEIGRVDRRHSNQFDLSETQSLWDEGS